MTIPFEDDAADRLVTACAQANEELRGQSLPRASDRFLAMVDFEGPYATLFWEACLAEGVDRSTLASRIEDLGNQVKTVTAEAKNERKRRKDLEAWQEREEERERNTGPLRDIADGIVSWFDPQPSTEPIHPTPISVAHEVQSRQRVSSGASSTRTSAVPDTLRSFATNSRAGNSALRGALQTFRSAWNGFEGACSWAPVDSMTCVTAFEQLLAENAEDAAWASKLADLFEIAGGGTLPSVVLDLLDATTSHEERLRLWATEFTQANPELIPLLGDRIDDADFLSVLSRYQDVFDSALVDGATTIAMLDDVSVFAHDYPVLFKNLDTFLMSDTSGGIQVLNRLEVAQIFAHANPEDSTAILSNLDGVTIVSTTGSGVFRSSANGEPGGKIEFNLDEFHPDRGQYFTLLHEMSHAADYNFGLKDSGDGYVTGAFTNDAGLTLDQVALADFSNDARGRLNAIANEEFPDMTAAERTKLVNETVRHLTDEPSLTARQFTNGEGVSEDSALLYRRLVPIYTNQGDGLLNGPYSSGPSDVYGGITNHKIEGSWAHPDEYWFDAEGPVRTVEKELFAETMAWRITSTHTDDTTGLDAIRVHLPNSEMTVDQIADKMGNHE